MRIILKTPKIKRITCPHKKVRLPKELTTQIAELVGIHFGDGSIYVGDKKNYRILYCFNINEKKLIADTKRIFKELFSLDLKERKLKVKAIELHCLSKRLCYFFHENFGAPLGKKDYLKIPDLIKSKDIYLKSFLKGLFRTDGCSFIKKDKGYQYPMIKITTKIGEFAKEIQESLINLGFRATLNYGKWRGCEGYSVVLHGKDQHDKWFSEIMRNK